MTDSQSSSDQKPMEEAIIIVHILTAIAAGIALSLTALLAGLPVWLIIAAYIVGANGGLVLSVCFSLIHRTVSRNVGAAVRLEV
jgi:membrane associated rhomboid family serine protease